MFVIPLRKLTKSSKVGLYLASLEIIHVLDEELLEITQFLSTLYTF